MNLEEITPLILTFNEEPNLRSTLEALSWASRIIIVDSNSTDATLAIAADFPQVKVHQYVFDNHTNKWNYGLAQVETEWVLTLDSDYKCPAGLPSELVRLAEPFDAYFARFRYCVFGHQLRASLYPPRAILFRPSQRKYVPDGHTQTLELSGVPVGFLDSVVLHDDRKPLARWCSSQVSCAKLELEKLHSSNRKTLGWKDRIRKNILFAPVLTLFYCLFFKCLIINGWPGIFYTLQRVLAELILSLTLLEDKLNRSKLCP